MQHYVDFIQIAFGNMSGSLWRGNTNAFSIHKAQNKAQNVSLSENINKNHFKFNTSVLCFETCDCFNLQIFITSVQLSPLNCSDHLEFL